MADKGQVKLISIVIPLYNEEEVIRSCHQRLAQVTENLDYPFEFIFIDDGSTDYSVAILLELQQKDSRIKLLKLSRNFGKEAALTAGIDYAMGEALIVIDADLQDPPELFSQMLAVWEKGEDVVCMRRKSRAGETTLKKISSYAYYRFLNYLSEVDIPYDVGDFRLLSRAATNAIKSLPEKSRYMKGLFAWVGFNPVFIEYDRDPRLAGTSKWNYFSLFKLAFDGITSFSVAPLHWVMFIGILTSMSGLLFGTWIVAKTLLYGDPVAGYPSMIALMAFLGGIQLFATGVLGAYLGKTFIETKQRPLYLVQTYHQIDKGEEKIDAQ
jgi:glycosyltransferase involved in cell wall biosynthesis